MMVPACTKEWTMVSHWKLGQRWSLCVPRNGQWSVTGSWDNNGHCVYQGMDNGQSLEVGTMMVTVCTKEWTMVSHWKLGQRWSLRVPRNGQWSVTGSWDNDGHCVYQGMDNGQSLEVGTMMVTVCTKEWTMVSHWKLGQ